jgi:hypothetical protein
MNVTTRSMQEHLPPPANAVVPANTATKKGAVPGFSLSGLM